MYMSVNSLRPRQNRRHFADDIFKCILLNKNVWIPIKISLKFVPKGPIDNIPAMVQIMAWRRPGDKPLSEPMMVNLPTHICVARPQWVNITNRYICLSLPALVRTTMTAAKAQKNDGYGSMPFIFVPQLQYDPLVSPSTNGLLITDWTGYMIGHVGTTLFTQ